MNTGSRAEQEWVAAPWGPECRQVNVYEQPAKPVAMNLYAPEFTACTKW